MDISNYMEHRNRMNTGDMILWTGTSPVSWLIRPFSHKIVFAGKQFPAPTHASLIIRLDDETNPLPDGNTLRVYQVEALAAGADLTSVRESLQGYSGQAVWWKLKPHFAQFRQAIALWALDQDAKNVKYDFGSTIKQAVCRVNANARRLFCSELVYLGWVAYGRGIPIRIQFAPRPWDLPGVGACFDPIQL